MGLSFIHVVAYVSVFFFTVEKISHCVGLHTSFIYPFISWHAHVFISLGFVSRIGTGGSCSTPVFKVSKMPHHFTFPPAVYEDLSFSTCFPTGVIIHLCGFLLFFLLVLLNQVQNVSLLRVFLHVCLCFRVKYNWWTIVYFKYTT